MTEYKFDYFECPDCGFDSVQRADFIGSEICPICAEDNAHSIRMTRRPATADDRVEGYDARVK